MVLGIIGKVGSGKSAVSKYLVSKYLAFFISSDDVAKDLIASGNYDLDKINENVLFSDKVAQDYVRKVVHIDVINEIKMMISRKKVDYELIVVETALPYKSLLDLCDKTILIENTIDLKRELLKTHRNYDDAKIDSILKAQEYYDDIYKTANYKILNDGTKEDLYKKIDEVINEIHIVRK